MKDAEEVAGELFRGVSEERKQNKEKRAKDDAAVEVVGERFQICMEAATNETEPWALLNLRHCFSTAIVRRITYVCIYIYISTYVYIHIPLLIFTYRYV